MKNESDCRSWKDIQLCVSPGFCRHSSKSTEPEKRFCKQGAQQEVVNSNSNILVPVMNPHKKKKIEREKPEPIAGRCHFYVERKFRYCKAPSAKDKHFCIEHSYEMKVSPLYGFVCNRNSPHMH